MERFLVAFAVMLFLFCYVAKDSCCIQDDSSSRNIPEKLTNTSEENPDMEFFRHYQRFSEIMNYLKMLAEKHPTTAKVFSIGKSFEDRDLIVIRIGPQSKPGIWIDGGTHAREWISPATVMHIATKLVTEYNGRHHPVKESTIQNFCWYILPVVNPDGYEYSHETDRMWRKNRNVRNTSCPGVDLNRNWGYFWNERTTSPDATASQDACSEIFAGTSAFSEPETQAIANFLLKQSQRQAIVAFLSFHSFGKLWLTPWGWTKAPIRDYANLEAVAKKAVDAIYQETGTKYEINSASGFFDIVSGGSADWAYGVAGIKYTYSIELPDRGYEFTTPEEYILPIAEETWESIKALAKAINLERT